MNLDQFRPIVRFLRSQNKNSRQIHSELLSTYDISVPSYGTIARWVRDIDRFGGLLDRGHGPGRPITQSTEENIEAIRSMIEFDRKLSLRQISDRTGLPYSTVRLLINDRIGMKKVFARWVPKTLTRSDLLSRLEYCNKFVSSFGANWDLYRKRIITVDETWVSYQPDSGLFASAEWRYSDEQRPERPSVKLSTNKVMVTIFWDYCGILLVDYLPKGTTFNSDYYCQLLEKLKIELASKRPNYEHHKFWLLQDNARVHTSRVSMSKIAEIGLKVIPHPPYSPDLSPSDYYLFRNLKSKLRLRSYEGREMIEEAIRFFFMEKETEWFSAGIDDLPNRVSKVLGLDGHYLHD